ncbi:MAG TPA: protein kinase [Candidatus Sulfotelmatobacter sp.]|nr:protein kinase [Candidatus Sulfotelmatobacter sp.]
MNAELSQRSLIGCELGHYRIVERIGAGGMGEVFLAHDEHLGHNVALKVLPPETNDRSRELFRKEAHALSRLNHPNIVTVLDFDTQEDLDFLVMEYVPGQALDEKVQEGPLAEKDVVEIGLQLAEGLAAAHAQGVVHRDLKPGNLRLTSDNRLKILDFGLARSTLSFSPLASTVSINGPAECSGTLPYMAGEQVLGQGVDARTDIYSAGAVLYELCTGRPPFEQTLFAALVDDILHKAPHPPSQGRKGVSPRVEAIILKCLEKEPEKRFQSAKELARELADVAALHSERESSRFAKARKYGATAALLLLLLILLMQLTNRRVAPIRNPAIQIESLAVLPFANLSGDSQHAYLADGMTDFLITDLGRMNILRRIISRTSVEHYKTERKPLREIARELNVEAVIEGSVTRSDKAVQVSARLVSAKDDRQLWSHSYESDFRDLMALQRELALAIASQIHMNVQNDGSHLAVAHPIEPAAQEAYLRGKYLQFGTAEQSAKSRQYFEQAIRLDPTYAAPYAGLADSYWNDIGLNTQETMPKAREYALKALRLDDSLADAHTALATVIFYGDWNWPEADREYQRALQLNPNDAESHRMYSVFLAAMGQTDDAWAQVKVAQELDPLYYLNETTAGWVLYCARRYDDALEHCQKAAELAPNYESTRSCLAYSYLGRGQYPQAVEESRKAWLLSGRQPVWGVLLARSYALSGDSDNAREILAGLLQQSRGAYVPPYFLSSVYAAIGDKNRAMKWLDRGYRERDLYLAWIKVDPGLEPLRSETGFQELSKRMGLSR